MSYNQSFAPQTGLGNLSAQFGGGPHRQSVSGSSPRDIPGRPRRQSPVSAGYYQQPEYGSAQPGYGTSPSMAYSPHGQGYAGNPAQHLGPPPPNQGAYYGSPSAQPYGAYGTSPQHVNPMATSYPGPGWQQPQPQWGPSSYPPPSSYHPSMEHRRKSSTSSYSHSHHSGDSHSDKPKKSKRRPSVPSRYDSPRRPTLTDSVIAAWGGLKGAFDGRK